MSTTSIELRHAVNHINGCRPDHSIAHISISLFGWRLHVGQANICNNDLYKIALLDH